MNIETAKVIIATLVANQAELEYPGAVAASATPARIQALAIKRARTSDLGEKNKSTTPNKQTSSESSCTGMISARYPG